MSEKDKEELVLNPVTGQLDLVVKFNPDRIIVAERNSAGTKFMTWDPASQTFIEDAPHIVVTDDGKVVTT